MKDPLAPNPGLVANLVFRILLSFIGILACWVPLQLLFKHGEFAAVVLIIDVCIIDLMTISNSIIWPTDDQRTWWDGQGYCDIQAYLKVPMNTIYAACVFSIVYNLAEQVKVTRAVRDRREKIRRNLLQAALIFPIPIIQSIFAYFDLSNRYVIGTLIGCYPLFDSSWPKFLAFDIPSAIFGFLSIPYAVLIWKRYRVIAKQTQGILNSGSQAAKRANRTRRHLYNMSLSILIVYVPVQIYFLIDNLRGTANGFHPYNFAEIRASTYPYPWDRIIVFYSWELPFLVINQPWIPIATSAVIVLFFGMTEEARQLYRDYINWFKPVKDPPPPLDGGGRGGGTGTHESGRGLLCGNSTDSIKDRQEQDQTFLIERPKKALTTETKPSTRPRTRKRDFAKPHIPPRTSSLRHNFAMRTPTLESIRRSIRLPALRNRDTSSASNKFANMLAGGARRGSPHRNTNNANNYNNPPISLLPLHNMTKGKAAAAETTDPEFSSQWRRGSFLPPPGARWDKADDNSEFKVRRSSARTFPISTSSAGRRDVRREESLSTLMSESGSLAPWRREVGGAK